MGWMDSNGGGDEWKVEGLLRACSPQRSGFARVSPVPRRPGLGCLPARRGARGASGVGQAEGRGAFPLAPLPPTTTTYWKRDRMRRYAHRAVHMSRHDKEPFKSGGVRWVDLSDLGCCFCSCDIRFYRRLHPAIRRPATAGYPSTYRATYLPIHPDSDIGRATTTTKTTANIRGDDGSGTNEL